MLGTLRHRAVQETPWDPTQVMKIQDPTKLDPTAAMRNHGGINVRDAGIGKLAPDVTTLEWKENANSHMCKTNRSGLAQDARGDPLGYADIMNTPTLKVNVDGLRRSTALA